MGELLLVNELVASQSNDATQAFHTSQDQHWIMCVCMMGLHILLYPDQLHKVLSTCVPHGYGL